MPSLLDFDSGEEQSTNECPSPLSKRPRLASPTSSDASSEDTVPVEVAHATDGYDPEVPAEEDAAIRAAQAAARERPVPAVSAAITFGTVGRSACAHGDGGCASTCSGGGGGEGAVPVSAPPAVPFPTHLPLLPTSTKGRAVGKYRTNAAKRNGYTPQVVYWNGNRSLPACWKGNCTHVPTFGVKGAARPTRCGKKGCREDGMVNLKQKMCETCGEHVATFGVKGAARPTRCGKKGCREDGMVNLVNKMCETCGEHQPTFGVKGAERPTRCGAEECREDGMVNLKHKMCETCGEHRPTFGVKGAKRPTRCGKKECREDGMVDLVNKMCETCGEHQPTFGVKGAARPTRCGKKGCREDGMVDLANKMCETCGEHQPTFGVKGAARPTRCGKKGCREDGMVDLANKMCETCGEHQPTFGFKGAERPTRCNAEGCREDGMVDLKSKMCACDNGLARYEDTDGNLRSLCYGCAIAEGTHPERVTGASYEACRFFCLLKRMAPKTHGYVPHVHWDKPSGEWNGYQEVEGLVEGRKIRPDGFLPDPSGATKGTVYLFHGNRWHGYPPGHPKHGGEQVFRSARTGIERHVKNADLYTKTEADSQAYRAAGYKVVEMWEHDFKEVEKQNGLLKSKLKERAPPYVF